MAKTPNANERVQVLLSVFPWLAENGSATLEELGVRFDCDPEILREDLRFVFYNLEPWTGPDAMIRVEISDDGLVSVQLADYFGETLQLELTEALMLLAAGKSRIDQLGDSEALASAVQKLALAIGERALDGVSVDLGSADPELMRQMRTALGKRQALEIDYYTQGSDSFATRTVEPHEVRGIDGHWYLTAHCRTAEGSRHFRADRILRATPTGPEEAYQIPETVDPPTAGLTEGGTPVEFTIPTDMLWVLADVPKSKVAESGESGDRVMVTVPIHGDAWLDRLLLRLGVDSEARDLDANEDLGARRAAAAEAILSRYG